MAFHLLYTWSIGGYAVAVLQDSAMEIKTPSRSLALPGDTHYCVTFYYNLGEYAALDFGLEIGFFGYQEVHIWSSPPSDLRNTWLRMEATVYGISTLARVCKILSI